MGANRDGDLAATLPGHAARLVHPLFCKSVLLPVSAAVQLCDAPGSVPDASAGGPTYCYELDSNLFPTPFPGTTACLLAQLGKISVDLGSIPTPWRRLLGKRGCPSAARASAVTPAELPRGPSARGSI